MSLELGSVSRSHGDIAKIGESDGTTTLIQFNEPMGIVTGYSETEVNSVNA